MGLDYVRFRKEVGQKLSEQTGAELIESTGTWTHAHEALVHLGLEPPAELHGPPPEELWNGLRGTGALPRGLAGPGWRKSPPWLKRGK